MTTIFVDRLSLRLALRILVKRLAGPCAVVLIEMVQATLTQRAVLALLRVSGVSVSQSTARLCHIDTQEKRDILAESLSESNAAALKASVDLMQDSPLLREMDSAFREGSVSLILAKHFLTALRPLFLYALTADHLAQTRPKAEGMLHFDSQLIVQLPVRHLRGVTLVRPLFQNARAALGLLRMACAETVRGLRRRSRPASRVRGLRPGVPAVAVWPDTNISLDRSNRSSPHWFFPREVRDERFQVIVLHNQSHHIVGDKEELLHQGLLTLRAANLSFFPPAAPDLEAKMWRAKAGILRAVLTGHAASRGLTHLFDHLRTGLLFARMARTCGVKAMITQKFNETMPDSINLIADDAGLTTYQYQHSFANTRNLMFASRSDVLFLFSNFFRGYYDFGLSKRVVTNGYVYGSSLPLVRERCQRIRQALHKAGVRFILCFFPENYSNSFSSPTTRAEFLQDFQVIADFVASHRDMGLVVKAKFSQRSPARMQPIPAVDQLKKEGRYIEIDGDAHSYSALPYEAAGVADIVLGEAYGCTAVYEAALGGVRGVLHGSAGSASPTQRVLEEHNLVYPSLDEALRAIQNVYEGRPGSELVGDWSGVLRHFDSHGDFEAGHRMRRAILEDMAITEEVQVAP